MKSKAWQKAWVIVGLPLTIAACASNRVSNDEAQSLLKQQKALAVVPTAESIPLSVRSKAHAVGDVFLSSVATVVAPIALPQLQAASTATSVLSTGADGSESEVEKSLPAEERIEVAVASRLRQDYKNATSSSVGRDIWLEVKPLKWQLEYVAIISSSEYELAYKLETALMQNREGKPRIAKSWVCSGATPKHMSYEAWKVNDFAAVKRSIPSVAEACVQQLRSQGL